MKRGESTTERKTYSVQHLDPKGLWLNYILLPYGEFYDQTAQISKAKKGDILRFFQGGDHEIERVLKIPQDDFCDMLCRIVYGIPLRMAIQKWQFYAVLEGNDRNVISSDYCLWVIYGEEQSQG